MQLVAPSPEYVPSYAAALETGWSPSNVINVSAGQLAAIFKDPVAFVAGLLLQGGTITLPDGTAIPRLPFVLRWMWDGSFCGSISLRWQNGTHALPSHVLGHIGYAVVPWKRGRGYATEALRMMLAEAARIGLHRIEITADPDNLASQRVIEKAGGRYVEMFVNAHFGSEPHLRYVVDLNRAEVRTTMP